MDNVAVGTCQRCGNFMCRACRTRWQGRNQCLACAERALLEQATISAAARGHRRQALLSLTFGVIAWGLVLAAVLLGALAGLGSATAGLVILVAFLLMLSFVPALFGAGQGAVAVRARGDTMIIGTWGLVLSACHVGVVSGLLLLALWRQ
jgi:hypothetical protein